MIYQYPTFIYLYDGGKTKSLNLSEISLYLKNIFKKSKIKIREDFITYHLSKFSDCDKEKVIDNLAVCLAKIKVRNIHSKDTNFESLLGEIEYEKKRISNSKMSSFGILYDGFELMSLYSSMIPKEESDLGTCHIVFTNQLFGSWDEINRRYHARVIICGFLSIISTSGIVEAPAKPREFYLKKSMGIDIYALKEEFKGRFIDYEDVRMTEVLKGYTLQAIFYQLTGDPFCEDTNCRLYNAHWQQEVIHAQLNAKNEFCNKHQEIISFIKNI